MRALRVSCKRPILLLVFRTSDSMVRGKDGYIKIVRSGYWHRPLHGPQSVRRPVIRRKHDNPNQILSGDGLVIVVGSHAMERQITGSISEFFADGRYTRPAAREGGDRLRMRLSEDEILLLHD